MTRPAHELFKHLEIPNTNHTMRNAGLIHEVTLTRSSLKGTNTEF